MKKVFVFSLPGVENKLLVADNQEEAFERRGEVDPAYEYLPVQVFELEIEGYEVHAKPIKKQEEAPAAEPEPSEVETPIEKPPEKPKQKKKQSKK